MAGSVCVMASRSFANQETLISMSVKKVIEKERERKRREGGRREEKGGGGEGE